MNNLLHHFKRIIGGNNLSNDDLQQVIDDTTNYSWSVDPEEFNICCDLIEACKDKIRDNSNLYIEADENLAQTLRNNQ